MKPARILFGGLFQETNSYVDQCTPWSDFKVARGAEVFAKLNDGSVTDGFLGEALRHGFEIIPTLDAWALPGGIVEDSALEEFWAEFSAVARPALAAGIDGIFLVLHGAMTTRSFEDAEGELLARIRTLPGAEHVPIFGVLDLHANVTAAMCRHANCLLAYRENPHTDAKETGVRATALLARCLTEGRVPHMTWCRPPLMWAPPGTGTATNPMRALEQFAREIETRHPEIWAYNIVAGFSFADTAECGVSLSVVSVGETAEDRRLLQNGAELAWSLREVGDVRYPSVDEVVVALKQAPCADGPVVLVEPADNIGGGAPGDGTGILRALLKHRVERSLVVIADARAVELLADVPIGGTKEIFLGGTGSQLDEGPVGLNACLISRSDGVFTLEDPHSHLAAMSGLQYHMGSCAVVRCEGVTVLITSRKTPPFDLGQLRSQGIEPRDFAVIGVKAAVAHKQAYDRVSRVSHYVDTPGPCTSNLDRLPWQRLRRPVWPVDSMAEFSCRFS